MNSPARNITTNLPFVLLILLSLMLSISSCKKDEAEPISGCTNPKSDNYNPLAEIDNGDCVLWREKFIGEYDLSGGTCITSFNLSSPGDFMEIEPSTNATLEDKILISIFMSSFGSYWNVTAKVTDKYTFEITEQVFDPQPALMVSGNGTIDENGNLQIELLFDSGDGILYTCDFEASIL